MDDWLFVVSPEHARFYGRLFMAREIGGVRTDPECHDAPSIALDVDMRRMMTDWAGRLAVDRDRLGVYDFFFSSAEKVAQLTRFARSLPRPMIPEDLHHFFVKTKPMFQEAAAKTIRHLHSLYPNAGIGSESASKNYC